MKSDLKKSDVNHKVLTYYCCQVFDPCGSATWYATEYDAENKIAFGYVTGLAFDEWGTFSITELESIKRPFGLGIERDLYFKEQRFKEIIKEQDLER